MTNDVPSHPKLRAVDPAWVEHEGNRFLMLRDPLGLSESNVLVPQHLAPLLALCDGTRDRLALRTGMALRTGVQLTDSHVRQFIEGLDAALLMENGFFREASRRALRAYRSLRHRRASHADLVYSSDPDALREAIEGYGSSDLEGGAPPPPTPGLAGVVSPHIDYERGGDTYAGLWRRCAPALADIELAIIFGTDHAGSPGSLTLTRQSYATPYGVMPTETNVVDGLADILGQEAAFAEELHHVNEHSIELATVWLHHYMGGRACPVVPVLCGSFAELVARDEDPERHPALGAAADFLRSVSAGRRTLVVAAADLAHVGPAFGDHTPLDRIARASLAAKDARSLEAICAGDAASFFEISRAERDARKLCGLPPIYMALRTLDGVTGESVGYAQCPADADGGSLVSIAGVLLYEDAAQASPPPA